MKIKAEIEEAEARLRSGAQEKRRGYAAAAEHGFGKAGVEGSSPPSAIAYSPRGSAAKE